MRHQKNKSFFDPKIMITEKVQESYGSFFEQELLEEIVENGIYKAIPAGTTILKIDDYIKSIPLLLSGAIKIMREDSDGNELLLYYLEQGESCSMTMTCCIAHKKSEIKAVTEVDTELLFIPISKMEEWSGKYKSWRNFVFNSYNNRLNELFETIDNIAFNKMDERLLNYLLEKKNVLNSNIISTTHQEIAYEMNTSRVVISRLLKKLEQLKKVKLYRNYIEILDV